MCWWINWEVSAAPCHVLKISIFRHTITSHRYSVQWIPYCTSHTVYNTSPAEQMMECLPTPNACRVMSKLHCEFSTLVDKLRSQGRTKPRDWTQWKLQCDWSHNTGFPNYENLGVSCAIRRSSRVACMKNLTTLFSRLVYVSQTRQQVK